MAPRERPLICGQRLDRAAMYRNKGGALAKLDAGDPVSHVSIEFGVPSEVLEKWISERTDIRTRVQRQLAIARQFGCPVAPRGRVLDLGCGGGALVYAYRDAGFDACGFDVEDCLHLRDPADATHFSIGLSKRQILPFEDNSFDLVVTEQVLEHVQDQASLIRELHRVMKPGSCSLHVFPARYMLIEPHMYVPFGSILMHRWWYRLWAQLGIRNEYQRGLSAREVAHENAVFAVSGLRYVSNSLYEALLSETGFRYHWADTQYFATNSRPIVRSMGKAACAIPGFAWAVRTFHSRRLVLVKT